MQFHAIMKKVNCEICYLKKGEENPNILLKQYFHGTPRVHLVSKTPFWSPISKLIEADICVSKLTIIASDNGLSPGRRQAIIWNNAGILLIGTWGTNFNEILFEIRAFSFKNIHLKMSAGKWRPFCLGLNVLTSKATSYHSHISCE